MPTAELPIVPAGKCHCGCGGDAPIASQNFKALEVAKGETFRFISGHNVRSADPDWALEDRGYDTPCWVWQRALGSNGYARKRVHRKNYGAHRWYYEAVHGPIPEGHHLHHLCEQRDCVNPDHLQSLTAADHLRPHRGKLRPKDVRAIRRSLASFSGYGACPALASRYEVGVKTISDIKLGKTWVGV